MARSCVRLTPEQQAQVIRMRHEGAPLKAICSQLGHKMSTVRWTLAKAGVKPTSEAVAKNISRGLKLTVDDDMRVRYGVATWDELMDRFALARGGKRIGSYTASRVSMEWECSGGHRFMAKPANIQQGQWCRKCVSLACRLPFEVWKQRAKAIGVTLLADEHQAYRTPYPAICSAGHSFKIRLDDISGGHGCAKCAGNARLTFAETETLAAKKNGRLVFSARNVMTPSLWVCERGHEFTARANNVQQGSWCPTCADGNRASKGQQELYEYVLSLAPDAEMSTRKVIGPYELDVFVPSRKQAFEYDGLLYHSSFVDTLGGKPYEPRKYHRKALACRDQGVALMAVYEDEWVRKQDLIKAMVRWRLNAFSGTYLNARDLKLVKLGHNSDFAQFFEASHLDGHARASFAYGLFHGEILVCCASVRTNHAGEREIARLATHPEYAVRGGAARLISALKKDIPGELYTYSNNRIGQGRIYQHLGFRKLADNPPSYWYTDGSMVRLWRFRCRRINDPVVRSRYPTEKDQALGGIFSEKYLGHSRPLYQIHDYGHVKWVL